MNISLKPVSGFLKKYATLIPSIGITAAAIVLFVPILMIGGSIKKSMAASFSLAKQVQSELSDVPSKDKPQQVKFYMDKLEEEATKIETLALQSSQRDLVTYEDVIFPKPADSSAQVFHEFGRRYRLSIEQMLNGIKAMDAPSQAEIRAKTGAAAVGGMGVFGGGRQPAKQLDPRIDALCLSRAKEISVYAHPSAFAWYGFWEKYVFAGEGQALEDSWDSQVALWIYQDIIDTIQKMNGTSSTVGETAVKRLLGVSFSGPVVSSKNQSMYSEGFMGGMNTGAQRDVPNYITAELFSNFVDSSPTGRIGNEEVDIVHFAVSVVVDNRSGLAFLKELCSEKAHSYRTDFLADGAVVKNARHNQITVLQSAMKVVDSQSADHELYRYGKGAVIQLDLVCEYQFYRKSYDRIKPAPIRKRLGMPEDVAPPAETPAM